MMNDFLTIAEFPAETLQELLDLAITLKAEWAHGGNKPIFKNKVLAMIFQKPSLRTRVSFDMAMRHLGGDALYLSPAEIGLGKRESIADVARVLSGYVDGIMARVFAHDHVEALAQWANVPVINGLSDYNHPCQAMADALTIQEEFGTLSGKNITYVGDGNNVAVSLMHICTKLGANFTIANPEGFSMPEDAITFPIRLTKPWSITLAKTLLLCTVSPPIAATKLPIRLLMARNPDYFPRPTTDCTRKKPYWSNFLPKKPIAL
jgi:ornithine carbamoyltransferase